MKKKLSFKLLAFLVICSMSVICIQMPTPVHADVCTDGLEFCEAGCQSGNTCCFDGCWNGFVDCCKPRGCRFKKLNCVPL